MKKLTMLVIVLTVLGSVPAFALVAAVDAVSDHAQKSDLAPIQDSGRILGGVSHMTDKLIVTVEEPVKPVTSPIRSFIGETFGATKKLVNGIWGFIRYPYDQMSKK